MKIFYLIPCVAIAAVAQAEEPVDLATSQAYKMQYPFAPPPLFTPQTEMTTTPENQYNYQTPWLNASVAQDVANNTTSLLQVNSYFSQHSNLQRALVRHRGSNGYVVAQGYHMRLKDYEDANDNKVGAGYKRHGGLLMLGWLPTAFQEYRLGIVQDRIMDDKQPQYQMDALDTRRVVLTGMARLGAQDQSNTFNLNVRHISLDRQADNATFRPNNPKAYMDVDRELFDVKADYRVSYGNHHSQMGAEYEHDHHNALRTGSQPVLKGYRFANIHGDRWHFFYDHFWKISDGHKLSLGASYDTLSAEARNRNEKTANSPLVAMNPALATVLPQISSNDLWKMYYGKRVNGKQKTNGAGGAVAYEFTPSEQQYYKIGFDSLIRHPHNAERYTSLFGQRGNGWLGNPFLKEERHNRTYFIARWQGEGWRDYGKVKMSDVTGAWQIEVKADYDKVKNFITYDHARNLPLPAALPTPMKNNLRQQFGDNVIARNVDATLFGAELSVAKSLTQNLATRAKVRYQYGHNETDHRPLYNVRPLSVDWALDWRDYTSFGSYNLGTSVHYSHKGTRLDSNKNTGYGLDLADHFRSYSVVNLYGGVQFRNRIALSLGIDNLFNRQYYAFNEQPHVATLKPNHVAAPERTYWTAINFNF